MALSYQAAGRVHAASTQSLLGQVLGITGLGLLVTALAAYFMQGISLGIFGWVAFFIGFGLLFAINAVRENEALALVLYYVFTFLQGIWIAPVIGSYVRAIGPGVVYQAAVTTGVGMLALAVIVYATGIDFRRFQGIAFIALLALVLVGIISAFTHWVHPTVYAWATLAIFTLLVLIDFTRIKAGGDGYTPVQMALQLYLDAINIFLALLQIFGGGRSRD
ncbi:MAG: Bax inhibitor-1 family protein [Candidatus Eremiobacteraeota bacterium]|nr:Bax inhibitor-1 family protein [Candidatus Eremiobacteraeota bacterium]